MKDLALIPDGGINYDLAIADGDFVVTNTDAQCQEQLLRLSKGHIKQEPTVGVGIFDYIDDENPSAIVAEIRRQYQRDGMNISQLQLDANLKLAIVAEYPAAQRQTPSAASLLDVAPLAKTYVVSANQTLWDVAIITAGCLEAAYDIAFANNIAITEDLIVGATLVIPAGIDYNAANVNFFTQNNIIPGTN
jgi:hypothetical protein